MQAECRWFYKLSTRHNKLIINTLNTLSAECRQNGYNYFLGVSTKRAYTICTTDITHTTYYNNRQKHKPHCTTMP